MLAYIDHFRLTICKVCTEDTVAILFPPNNCSGYHCWYPPSFQALHQTYRNRMGKFGSETLDSKVPKSNVTDVTCVPEIPSFRQETVTSQTAEPGNCLAFWKCSILTRQNPNVLPFLPRDSLAHVLEKISDSAHHEPAEIHFVLAFTTTW